MTSADASGQITWEDDGLARLGSSREGLAGLEAARVAPGAGMTENPHMLPIEPRHDSFEGLPAWAQWTLDRHRSDFRPHRYADEQLEAGSTHDPLWNAAQRLNDRYSLDGRDLNGCVGVLWSVGGLHDRPWGEREVFGQVRFMSLDGARRKFDVEAHVRKAATPARPKSAAGTSASHRRRRERA